MLERILIVDDEVALCNFFGMFLSSHGYDTRICHSLRDGLQALEAFSPDVVLLDVHLPDGSGLDAIQEFRCGSSLPEVVLLTGYAEVDAAELAVRRGAWSYVVKTSRPDVVLESIQSALQCRKARRVTLSRDVLRTDGIVGTNPAFRECLDLLARGALTDASVLIFGETGTGKELFARALHNNSKRRNGNFVVVDCAALPESLVESVLFGYAKGAFTGADCARDGLVKQADGGTLFLDEVGEMPLMLQKPFLRVLQERRFRPVGAEREVESDFRLVAATNRDLDALVRENRFREDLLFRLQGVTLRLPPLRERGSDIQELVFHHMKSVCDRQGIPLKRIAPEFMSYLASYPWPGNVRELVHALESALVAAQGYETLFPQHLPEEIRVKVVRRQTSEYLERQGASPQEAIPMASALTGAPLREVRDAAADAAERQYLEELLILTKGDVGQACSRSGLSRSRFYVLLRKHGLSASGLDQSF